MVTDPHTLPTGTSPDKGDETVQLSEVNGSESGLNRETATVVSA